MEHLKNNTQFDPNKITKYFKNISIHPSLLQGKFTDPYFPPTRQSLLSLDDQGNYINQAEGPENAKELQEDRIEWKRASDMNKKWNIFMDKIEFDDVKQGGLGDCYFLSAISALAEYPYIIYEKFRTKLYDPLGYYELVLFIDGEWQIIFIDDFFPVSISTGHFAFAKPNGAELWAVLLEKAWAKVNFGYSNTICGIVSDPLHAITGFPTEYHMHKALSLNQLYETLSSAEVNNCIICSSTKNDPSIETLGLVKGHAYSCLAAKTYNMDDKNIQLIKLRNPWGYKEWQGDWSDKSKLWTPELKKYFQQQDKNDGLFWMSLPEYHYNFNASFICHLMYGSFINSFLIENEVYLQSPLVFNFQLTEDSKLAISVLFRHWRYNRNIKDPVRPFNIVIAKYNSQRDILSIEGKYTCSNDVELTKCLEKGYYLMWLFCNYDSIKEDNKPFRYVLNIRSFSQVSIKFVGLDKEYFVIQKMIVENIKLVDRAKLDSCKDFYIGADSSLIQAGISSLGMINKSPGWLKVTLTIKELRNVSILPPFNHIPNIAITIPPFQGSAIIGTRQSYDSVAFSFSANYSKISMDSNISTPQLRCKEYFTVDFSQTTNELNPTLYSFLSVEASKNVPKLDHLQEAIEYQSTVEYLYKQYNDLMEALNLLPPHGEPKSTQWAQLKLNEGMYIGEVCTEKKREIHGRGAFMWSDEKKTYVGYWTDGKMDISGKIFHSDTNKIIYEGEFSNGMKNGYGMLYFLDTGDRYEGEFENDQMQGHGIYYWTNGNKWDGLFKNNSKHGRGVLISTDWKMEIIEFENDLMLKRQNVKKKKTIAIEKELKTLNNSKSAHFSFKKLLKKAMTKKIDEILVDQYETSPIQIASLSIPVSQSTEELKRQKKLNQIHEMKLKNPFMVNMLMEIPQVDPDEEFDCIEQSESCYIGGVVDGNMHGRGAYFALEGSFVYHIGYYEAGYRKGYGRRYDRNKNLMYEGDFLGNFYHGKGKLYFINGDIYAGCFENGKMQGSGVYIFQNGAKWEGTFQDNMLHGTGIFYYPKSPYMETLVYDKNSVINRYDRKIEFDYDQENLMMKHALQCEYPKIFSKLEYFPKSNGHGHDLKWKKIDCGNNQLYIGQVNSAGAFEGIGCLICSGNGYHLSSYSNGFKSGYGCIYTDNWKLIHEGNFENNEMHGKGRQLLGNGCEYDGNFQCNKKNGLGVYTFADRDRWEGWFYDDELEGNGFYVSPQKKTAEEVEYKCSNIVHKGILYNFSEMISKRNQCLQDLCDEYSSKMKLLLLLPPTFDDHVLSWCKINCHRGYYVGQVNFNEEKHGRGIFIHNGSQEFYIGYFVNGLREGHGIQYFNEQHKKYEGNFHFDKPCRLGKYFYLNNNDHVEGNFDEHGTGKGIYYWSNGTFWKGSFYNLSLHGSGEFYSKEGQLIKFLDYNYGEIVI